MTIEELEQHIKQCGSSMATALMQYELHGCLADRGTADAYKLAMEAGIATRAAAEKAGQA